MTASKFHEILDPDYHTTSPEFDVRLEDIIGAADLSRRGRSSSDTSADGNRSSGSGDRHQDQARDVQMPSKRLSRIFALTRK